jgi:hypothetical protein
MSTAITIDQPHMSAGTLIAGKVSPFHLPHPVPKASLFIDVPDFKFSFQVPLSDLTEFEGSKVNIKFAVDPGVTLVLALEGVPLEGGTKFQPEQGSLEFQLADVTSARAQFIGSTLMAMLGLARETPLRVPELDLNLGMGFNLPLPHISRILLGRQTDYALIVIERATGKTFSVLPGSFSDKDALDSLTFAYLAITERSFLWPLGPLTVILPSTEENLDRLRLDGSPFAFTSDPHPLFAPVLDQDIPLGVGKFSIDQTIVLNPDEVRREFSVKDGHPVKVIVRSLTDEARFEVPDAPRLPDAPWDWRLQALIDLEPKLNDRLAAAYNELAASTLADLTDEEKARVTERPTLGADAHLMNE